VQIIVSGGFDDIRSRDIRLLHEASKFGPLVVMLWSDKLFRIMTEKDPKFPEQERAYLLESIRYVSKVEMLTRIDQWYTSKGCCLVDSGRTENPSMKALCSAQDLVYLFIADAELAGFPMDTKPLPDTGRKKVVVTGCFDWFHSGHVAFFEEASGLGDLIVSVGNDEAVTGLKGKGHPKFPQAERAYMVGSVRHVAQAIISSGTGWLDYEPGIARIRPDIFVVNEDGDRPEKRALCKKLGIEYKVLKRIPHAGLPRRESTELREGA
jgi:cytidyltransferase-like protein